MSKSFVKCGGLCVALVLVTLTLLFNAKCCKAATSVKINSSSSSLFQSSRGSSIDDCLDEGLDFVLGSAETVKKPLVTSKAGDPNHPIVDCGRGKSYGCVPKPNLPNVPPHCYDHLYRTTNRDCPK